MQTSVIYPCETSADARRVVYSTLFNSMRWNYWSEIADALRYVGITASRIEGALDELVADGKIETMLTDSARRIWRVRL